MYSDVFPAFFPSIFSWESHKGRSSSIRTSVHCIQGRQSGKPLKDLMLMLFCIWMYFLTLKNTHSKFIRALLLRARNTARQRYKTRKKKGGKDVSDTTTAHLAPFVLMPEVIQVLGSDLGIHRTHEMMYSLGFHHYSAPPDFSSTVNCRMYSTRDTQT